MRVMEWKRRRAEEMKIREQELAPLEQQSRVAALEAARKLAAARAEDTERRAVEERENTAEIARVSEKTDRMAKNSRERERRRAEIYAINAVMRCVNWRLGRLWLVGGLRCISGQTVLFIGFQHDRGEMTW